MKNTLALRISLCGTPGSLGRYEYIWLSTAPVIWPTIGARRDKFLLVVAGELGTELVDSRQFTLGSGMSYQVADGAEAHRSHTAARATLFIVD